MGFKALCCTVCTKSANAGGVHDRRDAGRGRALGVGQRGHVPRVGGGACHAWSVRDRRVGRRHDDRGGIVPASYTRNTKQDTRNMKHETSNTKRETRHARNETRNTKHGTRNVKHDTRNTTRETRNAKHEIRSRTTRRASPGSRPRRTRSPIHPNPRPRDPKPWTLSFKP
jgi:hypothetical protein